MDAKTILIVTVVAVGISGVGNVVRGIKKVAKGTKHVVVKVVDHQK